MEDIFSQPPSTQPSLAQSRGWDLPPRISTDAQLKTNLSFSSATAASKSHFTLNPATSSSLATSSSSVPIPISSSSSSSSSSSMSTDTPKSPPERFQDKLQDKIHEKLRRSATLSPPRQNKSPPRPHAASPPPLYAFYNDDGSAVGRTSGEKQSRMQTLTRNDSAMHRSRADTLSLCATVHFPEYDQFNQTFVKFQPGSFTSLSNIICRKLVDFSTFLQKRLSTSLR